MSWFKGMPIFHAEFNPVALVLQPIVGEWVKKKAERILPAKDSPHASESGSTIDSKSSETLAQVLETVRAVQAAKREQFRIDLNEIKRQVTEQIVAEMSARTAPAGEENILPQAREAENEEAIENRLQQDPTNAMELSVTKAMESIVAKAMKSIDSRLTAIEAEAKAQSNHLLSIDKQLKDISTVQLPALMDSLTAGEEATAGGGDMTAPRYPPRAYRPGRDRF